MADVPAWLAGVLSSAITAIGMIVVGVFRVRQGAKSDTGRQLAEWAGQLRTRVDHLEERLEAERRNCDDRIRGIVTAHRTEVEERNAKIDGLERKLDELRDRVMGA